MIKRILTYYVHDIKDLGDGVEVDIGWSKTPAEESIDDNWCFTDYQSTEDEEPISFEEAREKSERVALIELLDQDPILAEHIQTEED